MTQFYTYLWLREDGTPYYVGKGKGVRAYEQMGHRVHKPEAEHILVQHFECEADSFFAEKFLIALYGRHDNGTGILSNLSDGGEGPTGAVRSDSTKEKLRKCNQGRILSEAHCKAIGDGNRGGKRTEETKLRMKTSMTGLKRKPFTTEAKLRMSQGQKKRREEEKAKGASA